MSAAELVHWFALYDVDPWTEDRSDLRSAIQCAVIANSLSSKGGIEIESFMLKFQTQHQQPATETDDELLKLAGLRWCSMMGGKVK